MTCVAAQGTGVVLGVVAYGRLGGWEGEGPGAIKMGSLAMANDHSRSGGNLFVSRLNLAGTHEPL